MIARITNLVYFIALHCAILPQYASANNFEQPSEEKSVSKLCSDKQTERQCKNMSQYKTRSSVHDRYKQMGGIYCNNETITDQASCRRIFKKHLKSGCLTEPFVRDLLFQGTPFEYHDKKPEERTYDYFAICMDDPEYVVTFCKCGCFDKSVNILTESKTSGETEWTPIPKLVKNEEQFGLFSLESEIGENRTPETTVHSKIEVLHGKQKYKEMVEIHTLDGRSIKLTSDHPLLTSENKIILAKDVNEKTLLVSYEGDIDPVTKVVRTVETLDVYNVGTKAPIASTYEHLIFANGLIVGDMVLQQIHSSEHANIEARLNTRK